MKTSRLLHHHKKNFGFTLLEVVLVMAITAMLVGVIFSTIHGVTTLTQTVTERAAKLRKESRLRAILERHFKEAGRANLIRLKPMLNGTSAELVMAEASSLMPPVSLGRTAVFEVQKAEHGFLNFNLVLLDEKDWLAYDSGTLQVGTRIPLLKELKSLEWRCFDPQKEAWENQYQVRESLRNLLSNRNGGTTGKKSQNFTLIELSFQYGHGELQRWVFSLL